MLVSFRKYEVIPRYDGIPWKYIRILESDTRNGNYNLIDSQEIAIQAVDPADPKPIAFTTSNATIIHGWYKVRFADDLNNIQETEPIQNLAGTEILADLTDINAHLDGEVIEADFNNTQLVQISVARVIRGYLSRVIDNPTLLSWNDPNTTPDIIREIAGMLIAAQVYFNKSARTALDIDDTNFAQRLYDRAIAMLNGIIDGTIDIPGITETSTEAMTNLDFFPIDSTDRAFTLSQLF